MAEIPQIVLPHGGYKNLIVYRKSDAIYQGTVVFCRRFLPKFGDRTVDQMTQAARSCKQNIAEGSASSGTSKETEIKLTNVARATLDELLEDYLDYLKSHEGAEWPARSEKKTAAREFAKAHADWSDWQNYFEKRSAADCCNVMIVIIQQTKYMLDKMIKRQEEDFKKFGGVRERMHAARTAARAEEWDAAIYSRLDAAASVEELRSRLAEVKRRANQSATAIARRKGWLMSLSSLASFVSLLSLLSFSPAAHAAGELPEGATVHVAPLTRAMWNQGNHYNRMCPVGTSSNPDGRMYAGCTAVAAAVILDYYQWPLQGTGDTKYLEQYWGADTVNQRARFDVPYDWGSIRDSYGHVVSSRESLAIATLMSDVGAILNMNYGVKGSSAMTIDVPDVFGKNFFFDNSSSPAITDFNSPENIAMIQMQLMAGHPIPCSGAANASGLGHTYVCDGYASTSPDHGTVTNLFHFNFGWGGLNNGWYPLDAVFTSAVPGEPATSQPVSSMYLGVYPQRAPQFARVPQVIPSTYKFRWGVATCWTNYLEKFVLERQELATVPVDVQITAADWEFFESGGDTYGWSKEGDAISGKIYKWGSWGDFIMWPGDHNCVGSVKSASISASTTVTIRYKAIKLPSGVSLKLTTCIQDPDLGGWIDHDADWNYFPAIALQDGASSSSLTSREVVISGTDLVAAFGAKAEVHFAVKVDDPGYTTPPFTPGTEIFRVESFSVSGTAQGWSTVDSQEYGVDVREATLAGLDNGHHRLRLVAKYSDGDVARMQEIDVSSNLGMPSITAVETNANSVVFEVADATNFGYGFEYQSNALKGTPSASGSRITWTFNKTLAELGTHWLTLTVSNKVNGFVTKYVHITNPPEDHPLCPYTETTYAAAIERANREKKLICMLSSGSPESVKFEKLGGFLSTNEIVSAIGGKYIFVESNGLLDSDRDLVKGLWRQQPVPMGMTPNPFDPQRFAYTFVIDPRSPNQAVPCSPTAYGGLNSQYDFKYLSYPQLEVNSYKTFLAQDFGIHFSAGGTIFIVY